MELQFKFQRSLATLLKNCELYTRGSLQPLYQSLMHRLRRSLLYSSLAVHHYVVFDFVSLTVYAASQLFLYILFFICFLALLTSSFRPSLLTETHLNWETSNDKVSVADSAVHSAPLPPGINRV